MCARIFSNPQLEGNDQVTDETPEIIEQKKAELGENDPRLKFEQHYASRGVGVTWRWSDPYFNLVAEFPNGRKKRRQIVTAQMAGDYWSIEYPEFTYLGDFDAALFPGKRTIEASILPVSPTAIFQDLPGVRRIGSSQMELELDDEIDSGTQGPGARLRDTAWVLEFTAMPDLSNLRVEMGSASREFNVVSDRSRRRLTSRDREPLPNGLGRFTTIRISGVEATRHDAALDILNRISGAAFFEMDLQYGMGATLAPSYASERERTLARVRRRQERAQEAPRTPRNQYPEKPLSLYWYGRSSSGLPLLQYLAYYQVLEYFFPSFSRRETLERLRNELLDPRFRPDDDNNLVRVINLASGTGRGFISEREQLRSTIGGCVTESHIREFIEGSEFLSEHFSGQQKIKDVARVNLADKGGDLLTSVSNRVYDIRCRIVHAKEDGGTSAVDLLLPSSREAEALGADIELIKFLAQKVLIAGASRLSV
jgi:hypothetical protein